MMTRRNLTIWIAAALDDQDAITLLSNHYFAGVGKLNSTWMDGLTGKTSWIYNATGMINSMLVEQKIVTKASDVTP